MTTPEQAKLYNIMVSYDKLYDGVRNDCYGEFADSISKVLQGTNTDDDLLAISSMMDLGKVAHKEWFVLEDILGDQITTLYFEV